MFDLCLFSLSSEEQERFELESVALRIGQPRGVPFDLASTSEVEIDEVELDPLKLVVLDSTLESVTQEEREDPSFFF